MSNELISQNKIVASKRLFLLGFCFVLVFIISSRIIRGDQLSAPVVAPQATTTGDDSIREPSISLNYTEGSKGSDFFSTCENFPADTTVEIYLTFPNGQTMLLGNKLTDASGACNFTLDTSDDCSLGEYGLTVSGGGVTQTATFTISQSHPYRESKANIGPGNDGSSGGGDNKLFLPLVH